MQVKKIDGEFSVCKVTDFSEVDVTCMYSFMGISEEENSLVCLSERVPTNVIERDDGWKAFRIQGILDFSLIGILANISTLLADNQIGLFAISTFNTDYILVKKESYCKALDILANADYQII